MTRLAALASTVLAIPALMAADPATGGLSYTPPSVPAPPDLNGLLFRLVGLTAVMLTLCGGVMWWVRRSKQMRTLKTSNPERLRGEGSLTLDRRSALHLVHADGHTVAVTTDATGLRSMVLLSEPFDQELAAVTESR